MITIKSAREIEIMRRSGKITAKTLSMLMRSAQPRHDDCSSSTGWPRNRSASRAASRRSRGITASRPRFAPRSTMTSCTAFPAERALKEGDVLSIDIGTTFEGYVSDTAVDDSDRQGQRRGRTPDARDPGVLNAGHRPDAASANVCRISRTPSSSMPKRTATASFATWSATASERRCTRSLRCRITGPPGQGIVLRPGLVLAIEPMITEGTFEVETLKDGWTVVTADGKLAAHFEHTIALTEEGPRILTLRDILEHPDAALYRPKEEIAA